MKALEKLLLAKEILRNWLFIRLSFFKENYKTIALDLSKQQALDADPRSIPCINVIRNLDRDGNTTMFFILEEA